METYLIVDPSTGRGIGHAASAAPGYMPGADEVACTPEQYAEPTGWMRVGAELVPAPPIPDGPAELMAYAKDARYAAETAGTMTAHGPIATDDRSKILILGALMAAQADPAWTTPWQFTDGTTAVIDRDGILALSAAAQAHVNAAFAAFGRVQAGIKATPATVTTRAQIDAAFAALRG